MISRTLWQFLMVLLIVGLWMVTVQAQVSAQQTAALVEALRLAAPVTGKEDDGLYSDWQVKPDNIIRWSKRCLGVTLTIEEFEARAALAREILECKMEQVLSEQWIASNGDESLAVRRAAAWWMTGDPQQYDHPPTADYTQKVLQFYRQQLTGSGV